MNRTPEIYYQYSEDFDYRKYLEERSHTDRIVWSIDEQTSALVTGESSIVDAIGRGASQISDSVLRGNKQVDDRLGEINTSIENGFTQISIDLNEISSDIHKLSVVCEYGFESLEFELKNINENLNRISDLLETPEQTWAIEQYKNAKICIERDLLEEANEYLSLAIHGDANHLGYKIEPAYHFTQGSIFAGDFGTANVKIDLNTAVDAFVNCARLAKNIDLKMAKRALSKAAWLQYGQGNLEGAKKLWHKAVDIGISSSFEADFLLARTYLETGDQQTASEIFINAVINSPALGFRANNDPVFSKYTNEFNKWLIQAKSKIHSHLKDVVESTVFPKTIEQILTIETISEGSQRFLKDVLAMTVLAEAPQPLTTSNDLFHKLNNLQKELLPKIDKALKEAEAHIVFAENDTFPIEPKKNARAPRVGKSVRFDYCCLGIFSGPVICGIAYGIIKSSFWFGILGVLAGVIIGPVVGAIIYSIVVFFDNKEHRESQLEDFKKSTPLVLQRKEKAKILKNQILEHRKVYGLV
jgi:tetratricopeptide (TPR) repeat protein